METDELFRGAQEAYASGDFQASEAICHRILRANPTHADASLLLGMTCVRLGNTRDAMKYMQLHLAESPDSVVGHAAISNLYFMAAKVGEARRHALRGIKLRPGDPSLYAGYARDLANAGFAREAEAVLDEALKTHSSELAFIRGMTAFLIQTNHAPQATRALGRVVGSDPDVFAFWLVLGELRSMSSDFNAAVECGRQAVRCDANSIVGLRLLATALASVGDYAEAAQQFERITELSPTDSEAWFALGSYLQRKGDFDKAMEFLNRSVKARPSNGIAQYALLRGRKAGPEDDELLSNLERLAGDDTTPRFDRLNLYFAIGKAREDREEFERAISAYDLANLLGNEYYQNPQRPWDAVRDLAFYKHLTTTFTRDLIRDFQKNGLESEKPVLIVGMPRSGTSLIEQILSNHPKVAGAGEIAFWNEPAHRLAGQPGQPVSQSALLGFGSEYLKLLESIGGDALRITDKVPQNFLVLGVICAAFPSAKVIHVQRNPVDTCLSIYTTGFGKPPLFTHRRQDIVAAYQEYDRAMRCWREALPEGQLMEVNYEEVVADREKAARSMVEFIGLDWDDACLHHERNKRIVETASLWQVRQPIYDSSIGRWKKFEPWIPEFIELEKQLNERH